MVFSVSLSQVWLDGCRSGYRLDNVQGLLETVFDGSTNSQRTHVETQSTPVQSRLA